MVEIPNFEARTEDRKVQFPETAEALSRHYDVLAVDPYSVNLNEKTGEARLSLYSHFITHAAGRIIRAGIVNEAVLFGDASLGEDYPSTADLMANHFAGHQTWPDQVTKFNDPDQDQTATQVKRLSEWMDDNAYRGRDILYLVWNYHKERVENHLEGFGIDGVTVIPFEETYALLNPTFNPDRWRKVLPMAELEKMESFRRKVSRYDKKGYVPRLMKPVLGGSVVIDSVVDRQGNIRLMVTPGKKVLAQSSVEHK